jgi:hypothetical protein
MVQRVVTPRVIFALVDMANYMRVCVERANATQKRDQFSRAKRYAHLCTRDCFIFISQEPELLAVDARGLD